MGLLAFALWTFVKTRCPVHRLPVSNKSMGIRRLTIIIMGSSNVLAQENASVEFHATYVDGPLGVWHTIVPPIVGAALLYVILRFLRQRVDRQRRDRRLAYWFRPR